MATFLVQVLRRVTRLREAYEAALLRLPVPPEPRSVVVAMGRAENFAHHLWNYYPGLQRLVDTGLAERVSELHSAGTEFFGPVQGVFPEFVGAKVVRNPRGWLWDPYPFSPDRLLVQPGGYFVSRALVERVVRTMAELPVVDSTAHQPVFGERPFPIVWIGLRVGSRSWSDQESQIPELVRRLAQRYPRSLFLLDGFSYPLGEDEVSAKWSDAIDRLRELGAGIVAASPEPGRVLNLVGNTLRESVLWAREVDTYLTPLGTSQHKVGWLTDAPGAVFGPVDQRPADGSPRRFGAWAAEGVTLPAFVVGEPVDDGERRHSKDVRPSLQNLRLDLDELVETMSRLIEQRSVQLASSSSLGFREPRLPQG
jgi:hypothetical protein